MSGDIAPAMARMCACVHVVCVFTCVNAEVRLAVYTCGVCVDCWWRPRKWWSFCVGAGRTAGWVVMVMCSGLVEASHGLLSDRDAAQNA